MTKTYKIVTDKSGREALETTETTEFKITISKEILLADLAIIQEQLDRFPK